MQDVRERARRRPARAPGQGLDVRPAPFPATDDELGTFDVLISIEVIEHVTDPRDEVAAMRALLRRGRLRLPDHAQLQLAHAPDDRRAMASDRVSGASELLHAQDARSAARRVRSDQARDADDRDQPDGHLGWAQTTTGEPTGPRRPRWQRRRARPCADGPVAAVRALGPARQHGSIAIRLGDTIKALYQLPASTQPTS